MNKSDFNSDFQNDNLDSKIVAALERVSEAFRVLLWQESKDFGLSPIQVQLLIFLLHHSKDKRKVSYLAKEFNMTKPTISDAIKILQQKRLVTMESDEIDARSYMLHLTKKGREIAGRTSFFSRQISSAIHTLHGDDKINLLLSLFGIIRQLNRNGVITVQRMCFNCAHYQNPDGGKRHFCKLLNQELQATEVRIDCPDHIPGTKEKILDQGSA